MLRRTFLGTALAGLISLLPWVGQLRRRARRRTHGGRDHCGGLPAHIAINGHPADSDVLVAVLPRDLRDGRRDPSGLCWVDVLRPGDWYAYPYPVTLHRC